MWVLSLGREDPLEKEMATDCSILAWKIPWMKKPGGLQSMGVTKSRTQLGMHTHFIFQVVKLPKVTSLLGSSFQIGWSV